MDFLELVKKRKSVRRYISKPVSRDLIDRCLEAARLAPSACNSQPWSFIVVEDKKTRHEIVKKALSGIYRANAFVREATVLIVVVTEHSSYIARMGGQLRHVKYSLIDIGIAGEHLILQAAELGLGTCWLGWFNEKAVKKILGLSRYKHIDVMISLGYPEAGMEKTRKRKSMEKIRKYFNT
ncbi:MAG: nitroreductase family protein [Candidatus Aminicenantes bacterium]|nr:nitroreductase family protein [Candidatus Aminicenantes bacterium]